METSVNTACLSLSGVLAVIQTPWDESDRIDWDSLEREIEWAWSAGVDGLGTGMVSETLRLTQDERHALVERLVKRTAKRGVVFASVGAESTRQAVEHARHAEQAGCGAVMAIPPLAGALAIEHLREYFQAIAESVSIPLIVQDASGYVGQAIPLSLCVDLLRQYGPDKIYFKPEAAPMGPSLSALRDATQGEARALEGSGGISLVDCFRRGIVGTMPAVDLLDAVVALWRALVNGDDERVYQIYLPLCALVHLQMQGGLDGFLAIEKYLLVQRGLFTTARRRRPYRVELDQETMREVDRLYRRLQRVIQNSG